MVIGLLRGLSKSFRQALTIEHTQTRAEAGYDRFRLQISARSSE
jgi:hypothetical protein